MLGQTHSLKSTETECGTCTISFPCEKDHLKKNINTYILDIINKQKASNFRESKLSWRNRKYVDIIYTKYNNKEHNARKRDPTSHIAITN